MYLNINVPLIASHRAPFHHHPPPSSLNFISLGPMAAREHGAVYVHVTITSTVATELPGLVAIIQSDDSVTVSQAQVPSLVPKDTLTVSIPLVINCHPVRSI